MTAIDLFCGCGGLSSGLVRAGVNVLLGVDSSEQALGLYRRNLGLPTLLSNLATVPTNLPAADLFAAGTPYQDFEAAGHREEGDRVALTTAFARIVLAYRPPWFVLENVPAAKQSRAYNDAATLLRAHYGLTEARLDAAYHGVPQRRQRLLVVGRREGRDGELRDALLAGRTDRPLTVREALGSQIAVAHYYWHPRYSGRRAIWSVDEPAPTVTASSRPIPAGYRPHPRDATTDLSRVRALTLREAAAIQGFPRAWDWDGVPLRDAWQLLGNAVPVRLGEHLGRVLLAADDGCREGHEAGAIAPAREITTPVAKEEDDIRLSANSNRDSVPTAKEVIGVAARSIRVLSLCSGVGGLDLGLGLAERDARTVCYVEVSVHAAAVLGKKIEEGLLDEAPVWSDLRSFDGTRWRGAVDCVIGGYPCQPFSNAGRRLGADDSRHLWPHVRRIVEECRPRRCFFENVPGHLHLGFEQVHDDLCRMGYRVAAGLFSAAEVGYPQKRERLFILADSGHGAVTERARPEGRVVGERSPERGEPEGRCPDADGAVDPFPPGPDEVEQWRSLIERFPDLAPAVPIEPAVRGVADGQSDWVDRHSEIGNGVVPLAAAYAYRTLSAALTRPVVNAVPVRFGELLGRALLAADAGHPESRDAEAVAPSAFEQAAGVEDGTRLFNANNRTFDWPEIDLLFTDPPYKDMAAYEWLGRMAAEKLRPGRLALVYCDPFRLPEQIDRLTAAGLRYVTQFAVAYRLACGGRPLLGFISNNLRPVVVLSRGKPDSSGRLVFAAQVQERSPKTLHPWQQALEPAVRWIGRLSLPGDLVADPFAGTGTTAMAVRAVGGRRFVGTEIDPGTFRATMGRLAAADAPTEPGRVANEKALNRLAAAWRSTDQSTRLAFLDLPAVRAAVRRLEEEPA